MDFRNKNQNYNQKKKYFHFFNKKIIKGTKIQEFFFINFDFLISYLLISFQTYYRRNNTMAPCNFWT